MWKGNVVVVKKHDAIHNNQHVGRKGLQPQSAALNNTISMDIVRYYGEEAELIDNDTAACYDRIVPVLVEYSLL